MRILCLGDSIMQYNDFSTFPQTGWVQELTRFFPLSTQWLNFARNGRSTKSFIDEGRFVRVMAEAENGDFAFIQFGHNDEKDDPARHTGPEKGGAFRKNLSYFVRELKERGVLPVLFTPMARRMFDEDGNAKDSHGLYATAIVETAIQESIPCIDMNSLTLNFLTKLGVEKSRRLYMNFDPNLYDNFPSGREDNSHLRPEGANVYSKIAAEQIRKVSENFPEYSLLSDSCMNDTESPFLELEAVAGESANAEIDDEYTVFQK